MITQAIEKKLIVINEEVPKTRTEINDNDDLSAGNSGNVTENELGTEENRSLAPSNNENVERQENRNVVEKKTRKIIHVDDSDSDDDNQINDVDTETLPEINAENESVKRNRSLLDSDEEDNPPTNKKQKKFFDSDDDD